MNRKKLVLTAAVISAVTALAGCTDISGNVVVANTAPVTSPAVTMAPLIATTPDEPGMYDEPESYFTTAGTSSRGDDLTEPDAAESTTFPKQTTPEPVYSAGDSEENTSSQPVTAAPETQVTTESETAAATTASKTTAAQTETQTAAAAAGGSKDYNVIGENGILVSYQDGHYRGLMACFGTYTLCENWAKAANSFAKELPGVDVFNLVVPISSEFYTPQKYWDSGFTVSQRNKIDHIAENLSGVKNVDAYSALEEHKDEPIYSRTDHHWNPLGAYYAAEKLCAAAGAEYTPVSRSGYVGSMYTYSKDVHLYNDAETFTMYISPNADKLKTTYYNTGFGGAYSGDLFVSRKAASFYCSFLGSDDRIAKIETDCKNGRTLVIFKQSFGNALVPFLTSGFETIYVCDMRFFELNGVQFCKDVGATDLLFTDCAMIAAGNGGKYLNYILNK